MAFFCVPFVLLRLYELGNRFQHWSKCLKVKQREVYFHILKRQEVSLREAIEDAASLRPLKDQQFAYFKTECTHHGSKFNDERRINNEQVNENLKRLLAAVSNEPSVEGILFQARFGSLHFILQRSHNGKIKNTQFLKRDDIHKEFLFRVPFDPQYFIQGNCLSSSDEPRVRYRVKFKVYTADNASFEAACHMEEVDHGGESFELKWARIDGIVNPKDSWRGQGIKTKLDIVRPGRHVDIRIVSCLRSPECKPGDAAYDIALKIAKSMTRKPSGPAGQLFMQVVGDDYCVHSIRKKTTKTYKWLDPDDRDHNWSIIECYANNAKDMKKKYQELRRDQQYDPVIVDFSDQIINEIYFDGSFHAVRPGEDPDVKVSTPDQFIADFERFVSASFHNADLLEDIYCNHAAH